MGREYETDVIRINSQSGKGGIGYVLEQHFGFDLPPAMREDFGYLVKGVSDRKHKELSVDEIYDIFQKAYVNKETPFSITDAHYIQKEGVYAIVSVKKDHKTTEYTAKGNGRLNAVSNALKQELCENYSSSYLQRTRARNGLGK